MEPLNRRAYAKLNLGLEALRRRPDGYHELVTVFQAVSLWDDVAVTPASALCLRCTAPALSGRSNLAFRAAEELQRASGTAQGAALALHKAIPTGAGLGGGSSDAAAALSLLNRLWGLDWPRQRMAEIAGTLGADVPFFLLGGAALARGKGDLLTPLPTPRGRWFLLLSPPIYMPGKTRALYARLRPGDFTDGAATEALAAALSRGEAPPEDCMVNAFERAALTAFPGLDRYRAALERAAGRTAHLSGSGPSLFAQVDSHDAGAAAREALLAMGHDAALVETVSGEEA